MGQTIGKDVIIRKSTLDLPHRDLRSNFQGYMGGGMGDLKMLNFPTFFLPSGWVFLRPQNFYPVISAEANIL